MTKATKERLINENAELKRDLHNLRCKYGDLADLVSEVACAYEAGKELTFVSELVALYRKQQTD